VVDRHASCEGPRGGASWSRKTTMPVFVLIQSASYKSFWHKRYTKCLVRTDCDLTYFTQQHSSSNLLKNISQEDGLY